MNQAARRLLSGSFLLREAARPDRSFGSVSGETRPDGDSLVHAVLDASAYRARFFGGLSISMTESAAAALATALTTTTARLEQLRMLARIGALDSGFGAGPAGEWTGSVVRPAAGAVPSGAVELPDPVDEPRLELGPGQGRITYTGSEGPVRMTFREVTAVIRTAGGDRTVLAPGSVGAGLGLLADSLGPEVSGGEHFSFQSPGLGWDLIAADLSIDTGTVSSTDTDAGSGEPGPG